MIKNIKVMGLILTIAACGKSSSSRSVEIGDRIIRYSSHACEVRTFSIACGAGEVATVPGCMANCSDSNAQCVSGSIAPNCAMSASSCFCD